ncbi:hypothetical protein [Oceanobacillus manasiensis]|nr:hypothetical protein [Oceanobacillus manasiensis]
MRKITRGISKFFVANLTVAFAMMLLPVFLITDNVAAFEAIMDYLFNKES